MVGVAYQRMDPGSTLHKAVGLDTLKTQVQHYEKVVLKKQKTEFEEIFATNITYESVHTNFIVVVGVL